MSGTLSGVLWQLGDYEGSIRDIVSATSGGSIAHVEYRPFGQTTSTTGTPGLFGYAGGMNDAATGTVHFAARDYDPQTGRWNSPDPIGLAGGTSNLYVYAGNDPINYVDPSGLMRQMLGSVAGSLAGGGLSSVVSTALSGSYNMGQNPQSPQGFPNPLWSNNNWVFGSAMNIPDRAPNIGNPVQSAIPSEQLLSDMNFQKGTQVYFEPEEPSSGALLKTGVAILAMPGVAAGFGINLSAAALLGSAGEAAYDLESNLNEVTDFLNNEAGITNPDLQQRAINSFGPDLRVGTFQGQAFQYSTAGSSSSLYLTPSPVSNPVVNLALPPRNLATAVQQFTVSPTRALMGSTAGQTYGAGPYLPGGAQQIFVPSRSVLSPTPLLPGPR